MDLSFTPEERAFRDEVRTWIRDAMPETPGLGVRRAT